MRVGWRGVHQTLVLGDTKVGWTFAKRSDVMAQTEESP